MMTDLDKKLQEMALLNWPQFVQMIGADAILSAKICMLRQGNASYSQISIKLGVGFDKARYDCCTKCDSINKPTAITGD